VWSLFQASQDIASTAAAAPPVGCISLYRLDVMWGPAYGHSAHTDGL